MKKVQLSGGGLTSTCLTVLMLRELDHVFVADYDQDNLTDEWEAVNRTITALSDPYPLITASQLNLKFNNWLAKANTDQQINRGSLLMFVACCACEAIHKYGVSSQIQINLGISLTDMPDLDKFKKEYNEVLAVTFGLAQTGEPLIQVGFPYSQLSLQELISTTLTRLTTYQVQGIMGASPRILWDYSMPSQRKEDLRKEFASTH